MAQKECMFCYYWYFEDVGSEIEPHVCNKCQNILMIAYEPKNIAILYVKGVDFRCILWGISRDKGVNIGWIIMLEGAFEGAIILVYWFVAAD